MAEFLIEKVDGSVRFQSHCCFAWIGAPDRHLWLKIHFQAGSNMELTGEEVELVVTSLRESSIRHEGVEFGVSDKEGYAFWVTVNQKALYWQVLRVLKLTGKLFTYSSKTCRGLVNYLKKGANWQEASFLTSSNFNYIYSYPECKVLLDDPEGTVSYMRGGPMANLSKWNLGNRPIYSNEEFGKAGSDPLQHLAASGACHPLTMERGSFLEAKDLISLRKELGYE